MLKAVIIDDDLPCRDALSTLLDGNSSIHILASASNVKEGVALIKKHEPQLVFLDIEMPDGTGFDVLEEFPQATFQVIFTTGHNAYAIKAFKHSAVDYLLKPVQENELLAAVERAKVLNMANKHTSQVDFMLKTLKDQEFSKLAIPSVEGYEFIEKKDIVCCEADGSYTTIYKSDGSKIVSSHNLKKLNELIEGDGFFRIHKSHIIALKHVEKVLYADGGTVLLDNQKVVPIARRRKEEFLRLLGL